MRKQYIYTHRHCWWVCMEVSDWRRKTSVDVAIVSRKWCPDTVPGSRSNTPRSFSRRNWPGRIHRSLDNCSRLLARFASPTPTVSTVTFLIPLSQKKKIYIYIDLSKTTFYGEQLSLQRRRMKLMFSGLLDRNVKSSIWIRSNGMERDYVSVYFRQR